MRHHDIERLKEAARRYAANKYTVGDMEELSEFACNALFEPPCSEKIRKVDNGDGTETWYGLPVVVPVGLVPDDETPVEVRSLCLPITSRFIAESGRVEDPVNCRTDEDPAELCIILGRKPQPVTWTPPASLPNGEYEWDGLILRPICRAWSASKTATIPMLFADFTDPPRKGRYRKDGAISTWIGE
jgi:hypothetical protein